MNIPTWAKPAADSFFAKGLIPGATKAPIDNEISDYLVNTARQSMDAFVAGDNKPGDDDLAPNSIKLSKEKIQINFQGDRNSGSFTQVVGDEGHEEAFVQTTISGDGIHIFNAAKEGNDTMFLGQVINFKNPAEGYLLSTVADH